MERGAIFSIAVSDKAPSSARFNFEIDDVDGFWEQVKDKANIIQPIETMPYGARRFTITDLDGNELGFVKQAGK